MQCTSQRADPGLQQLLSGIVHGEVRGQGHVPKWLDRGPELSHLGKWRCPVSGEKNWVFSATDMSSAGRGVTGDPAVVLFYLKTSHSHFYPCHPPVLCYCHLEAMGPGKQMKNTNQEMWLLSPKQLRLNEAFQLTPFRTWLVATNPWTPDPTPHGIHHECVRVD